VYRKTTSHYHPRTRLHSSSEEKDVDDGSLGNTSSDTQALVKVSALQHSSSEAALVEGSNDVSEGHVHRVYEKKTMLQLS